MSEPERHDAAASAEQVRRKAERKEAARHRPRRSAWFGLGMFGLVGWAVSVPTLAGVALGAWLDRSAPVEGFSWTLALLLAGVGLGVANAWWWVQRESRDD